FFYTLCLHDALPICVDVDPVSGPVVSSTTFFWRSYRHRCTPSDPILTRDGGNTCRPRDLIMRCLIPPGRWYRFYPETTQIPSLSDRKSTRLNSSHVS